MIRRATRNLLAIVGVFGLIVVTVMVRPNDAAGPCDVVHPETMPAEIPRQVSGGQTAQPRHPPVPQRLGDDRND